MNIYKLNEQDSIGGRSSTGWLLKWNLKDKRLWIKSPSFISYWGGEPYAEIIASQLCKDLGLNTTYVEYTPCIVEINGIKLLCCESKDFRALNEEFISIEKLLRLCNIRESLFGESEYSVLISIIKETTKINYKNHLDNMLTLDYIICNYDRKLWNFGLLFNKATGKFREAPIFDFGNSLDLLYFKEGEFFRECIIKCADPFGLTFENQLSLVGYNKKKNITLKNFNSIMSKIEGSLSERNNRFGVINPITTGSIQYINSMVHKKIMDL